MKIPIKCAKNNNDVYEEDYVIKCTGPFGLWQTKIIVIASLSRAICFWNVFAVVYLVPHTEFSCTKFKNTSIDAANSTCYENCEEYKYYETVFEKTLKSEFGLICEKAWLTGFTQTVLMCGVFVGSVLAGWLSDRFGRRIAIILSTSTNVALMFASSFARDYWTFTILRFLSGMSSGGIVVVSIVLMVEVVGSMQRDMIGCSVCIPDGFSTAALAIFAYFSTMWNDYMLWISLASIPFMLLTLILPESPRWLIAKGRIDSAVDLITKAAKCNRQSTIDNKDDIAKNLQDMIKDKVEEKCTYLDLFRTKTLALKTVSTCYIWVISGIGYYGIAQYLPSIGSNVYMDVVVMGLMQTPAAFIGVILARIMGRKTALILMYSLAGTFMIILVFAPEGLTTTVIGSLGTCSITLAFVFMYFYTSELFPTSIRNMAYGFCAGGSKVGAMISPFIVLIEPKWIPSAVFAVGLLTAAAVGLLLPETKGQNLKDTIK